MANDCNISVNHVSFCFFQYFCLHLHGWSQRGANLIPLSRQNEKRMNSRPILPRRSARSTQRSPFLHLHASKFSQPFGSKSEILLTINGQFSRDQANDRDRLERKLFKVVISVIQSSGHCLNCFLFVQKRVGRNYMRSCALFYICMYACVWEVFDSGI